MQDQLLLTSFAQDTLTGLSAQQKSLSSKYFYDTNGSKIFQSIMNMPEYYLTDCELEIFETQTAEILESFKNNGDAFELVELGAGDGLKTKKLLSYFLHKNINFEYAPIDISKSAVLQLIDDLNTDFPNLKTRPLIGDYFDLLEELNQKEDKPKIILFLGSNIGNFREDEAIGFLSQLRAQMKDGDQIFIGFDLKKDANTILNAYNDPHGHTAQFNLNLLERINRELGGNFQTEFFQHQETYDPQTGAAKSFIISSRQQSVLIDDLSQEFHFAEGEKIFVEISQKYDEKMIEKMAEKSGFQIVRNFQDKRLFYMNSLWKLKQ